MSTLSLSLQEWRQVGPGEDEQLAGFMFADDASRSAADALTKSGRIEFLELAHGLRITTNSYVGSIALGNLQLSIRPKITGLPLLNLLRYAYGLRDLDLFEQTRYNLRDHTFLDLLIHQLATEVQELLFRGLHRTYMRRQEPLASPRGRIAFDAHARQASRRAGSPVRPSPALCRRTRSTRPSSPACTSPRA